MKITKKLLKNLIVEVLNETEEMMPVSVAEKFMENRPPQSIFNDLQFHQGTAYWQYDQIIRAMTLPNHPNTVKEEVAIMYNQFLEDKQIKDKMRWELERVLLALMNRPE